jgi:chromosome partitioning protein
MSHPRVIAIANQKGGVGKTTTTLNLAAACAETGERVLVVDFDPQGALTMALGVNPAALHQTIYEALVTSLPLGKVLLSPKERIDLAPATIDLAGAEVELLNEIGREHILRGKLDPLRSLYDWIFVDCPPSLGLLTINALSAADGVLIPVQCQYLSFRGMQLLLRTIEKIQARANPALRVVGLLPTMYDARTAHGREVLEELRQTYPELLIDEPIRHRVGLADAIVAGQSIFEYDRRSDAAQAYRHVAEVLAHGKTDLDAGDGSGHLLPRSAD